MKKLFLFLCVIASLSAFSQKYSGSKDAFVSELGAYFETFSTKEDKAEAKKVLNDFATVWQGGLYNADIETVMAIANRLGANADGKGLPNTFAFVKIMTLMPQVGFTSKDVHNWLSYTNTKYSKPRSRFADHAKMCLNVFQNSVLFEKGNTKWIARKARFTMPTDTAFVLTTSSIDLVLTTKTDSSVIRSTSGMVNLDQNLWTGQNGTVDWSRFALPADRIYATLPLKYEINLYHTEYKIDSVVFYHKDYFNHSILASFRDRVTSTGATEKSHFPKVESYEFNYVIKNIFDGVNLVGGFGMDGEAEAIFGDVDHDAQFEFYRNKTKLATLRSRRFRLTKNHLTSEKATASIYMSGDGSVVDSLFHSDLHVQYDDTKRRLISYRSDKGLDGPFYDSYHEVAIFLEAMYWQLDSDIIEFGRMEGTKNTSEGKLESMNYFRKSEYQRLQGLDAQHPMVRLEKYMKAWENPERPGHFFVADFAEYLHYPVEQVVSLVLDLQSLGYLTYDTDEKSAQLSKRFYDVIQSSRDSIDYDAIKLVTKTANRQPNVVLDMTTNNLDVYGITNTYNGIEGSSVTLSDVKHIVIFPKDAHLVLQKNRNMLFSGVIMAGMFEFHTVNSEFNYDEFTIKMPEIDSMQIYAMRDNRIEPVNGLVESLKGSLVIDRADNKSSREETPEYPKFTSELNSYKFFRRANGGAFDPGDYKDSTGLANMEGKFYYEVDPFVMDSLNSRNPNKLTFNGRLVSGGIFENIEEPLSVMEEDFSLGMAHKSLGDNETLLMYGGKAAYHNDISLTEESFWGNGTIDYQTSKVSSDHFVFYIDSVVAQTSSFVMDDQQKDVEFPKAYCETPMEMLWNVPEDNMSLNTENAPVCIYDSTFFAGNTVISPTGYKGSGKLTFANTKFDSKDFTFGYHTFMADSADFVLLADNSAEAFSATNYKASVDFDTRKAKYDYLDVQSNIKFPANQYASTLREAEWDMSQNRLRVYNPAGSFESYDKANSFDELLAIHDASAKLISTKADQDSLQFFCTDADYDMTNFVVQAHNVKIIRVADAAVFPQGESVNLNIYRDAVINTIDSVVIVADTIRRQHVYNDAAITIYGANKFKGHGTMDYVSADTVATPVYYDSIYAVGGHTLAHAYLDDSLQFMLSPNFAFSGDVTMASNEAYGYFDGNYRITDSCLADTLRFASAARIDPANISVPMPKKGINSGLYREVIPNGRCFAQFLVPARNDDDIPLDVVSEANGNVMFSSALSSYLIVRDADTLMVLTDQCEIKGHDTLNLGFKPENLGMTSFVCDGDYLYTPDGNLSISAMCVFDVPLVDATFMDTISAQLLHYNTDAIDLTKTRFIDFYEKNSDSKKRVDMLKEIELSGGYPKIKSGDFYDKTIVIPDMKLTWNEGVSAFISEGKIALGNLGRNVVNRYVEGKVVFDPVSGYLTFVFKWGSNYAYICYDTETSRLYLTTTYGTFIENLYSVKESKRSASKKGLKFVYEAVSIDVLTEFYIKYNVRF